MGFMKCCMIFTNILVWLLGGAALGVGIWAAVDGDFKSTICGTRENTNDETLRDASERACELAEILQPASILMIIVGALVLIIGILGCLGAIRESKCLLGLYAVILTILLLCEVAAGVIAFLRRDQVFSGTGEASDVEKALAEVYEAEIKFYFESDPPDKLRLITLNAAQRWFHCCGSYGPDDFSKANASKASKDLMPDTCFTNNGKEDYYKKGCTLKVLNWIKDKIFIVAIAGVIVAVLLIMGVCCSLAHCRSLSRRDEEKV